MKKNSIRKKLEISLAYAFIYLILAPSQLFAQIEDAAESEDYTWWYLTLVGLVIALGAALWFVLKSRSREKQRVEENNLAAKKRSESLDFDALDVDKEMEWLRKNQKIISKKRKNGLPKTESKRRVENIETNGNGGEDKMPVFDFEQVEPAKQFALLPLSNDEALLSAIEQTYEEDEEDENIRELSLRILQAFKTRNSVEALSQMALYDLSSQLRSRAVAILTEFDHESVFETILLACADPSREIRATAARGLTRLNFDRADAWARILQSGEEGRIKQAAHAATESGFVGRSFDRLVHPDRQQAYEAFVLLSLLAAAGETKVLFETIKKHKDQNVKLAVLHLLKVSENPEALDGLYSLLEDKSVSSEVRAEVDKVIKKIGLVAV